LGDLEFKIKIKWIKSNKNQVSIYTLLTLIEKTAGGLEGADVWGDQDDVSRPCQIKSIPESLNLWDYHSLSDDSEALTKYFIAHE
jgi:hypothetical protein